MSARGINKVILVGGCAVEARCFMECCMKSNMA